LELLGKNAFKSDIETDYKESKLIKTIGIIGQGFVGSAIRVGLGNYYNIKTFDLDKEKCNASHDEVCNDSDIIFVCLPTPMRKTGECDTRILESAVRKIESSLEGLGLPQKTVVIKSTVPPGTTDRINLSLDTKNIDVCFSPEFLTEANSFDDFKNQTRIIIGGKTAARVKTMFRKAFPKIPIIITKASTAETVKYFINCFLATKVSFANEMKQVCDGIEVDFNKVVEYALYDDRIGASHLSVPGPDGSLGFGGHCFPKDLNAIIFIAQSLNIDPKVLHSVWNKNLEVREDSSRDWEKMKGRAISD
jgi:nucleotide sugar dehydrogenase